MNFIFNMINDHKMTIDVVWWQWACMLHVN